MYILKSTKQKKNNRKAKKEVLICYEGPSQDCFDMLQLHKYVIIT